MFAKLYPVSPAAASAAARACPSALPPRVLSLHGLMGSGRNWSSVARTLSGGVPAQEESASYLRYTEGTKNGGPTPATESFRGVPAEVLTLDWRNHGRSVHIDRHGLDAMADDLDFILRKSQNPTTSPRVHAANANGVGVGEGGDDGCAYSAVDVDVADYGSVNEVLRENSLPWKGILGRPHVRNEEGENKKERGKVLTRADTMWYVPFTSGQRRAAERSASHAQENGNQQDANKNNTRSNPAADVSAYSHPQHRHQQPLFLMGHSMGGAAAMHFLCTRYASEWEAHLARREQREAANEEAAMRQRLFGNDRSSSLDSTNQKEGESPPDQFLPPLTPETDDLFPYLTLSGVVIVDIGPCERPAYSQTLGGAVVAVKTLPVPTRRKRAVGDFEGIAAEGNASSTPSLPTSVNPPSMAPSTDPFAAAAASPALAIPPPSAPLTTRAEAERHVMTKGPQSIFNTKSPSSVWIARYLLTNVVEGGNAINGGGAAPTERAPQISAAPVSEASSPTPSPAASTKGEEVTAAPLERNLLIAVDLVKSNVCSSSGEVSCDGSSSDNNNNKCLSSSLHWEPNIDVIARDLSLNTWRLAVGRGKGDSAEEGQSRPAVPLRGIPTMFLFGADSPYWHHTSARNAIYEYFPPSPIGGRSCRSQLRCADDALAREAAVAESLFGGSPATGVNGRKAEEENESPAVRLIPKAGHFVMTERQREFSAAVRSFIAKVMGG